MNGIGRSLVIIGLVLAVTGLVISHAPRLPWLGRLPGDIYLKKGHFTFFFPLTTCIVLSALLSLILWLLRR